MLYVSLLFILEDQHPEEAMETCEFQTQLCLFAMGLSWQMFSDALRCSLGSLPALDSNVVLFNFSDILISLQQHTQTLQNCDQNKEGGVSECSFHLSISIMFLMLIYPYPPNWVLEYKSLWATIMGFPDSFLQNENSYHSE